MSQKYHISVVNDRNPGFQKITKMSNFMKIAKIDKNGKIVKNAENVGNVKKTLIGPICVENGSMDGPCKKFSKYPLDGLLTTATAQCRPNHCC